jgi:hypothetical protein
VSHLFVVARAEPWQDRPYLAVFRYSAAIGWIVLTCACGSDAPSNDADAATQADVATETSGAGGASGATGGAGASGAAGASGGMAGSSGAAAGSGGTGGGGSIDAGGAAGSSRGGQAGTSGGRPDAARDAADSSQDATSNPDRDADVSMDSDADGSDAPFDTSAPPSDASTCLLPTMGVYATFRVVGDVFRASITNPTGIDQALALWRGQSQAKIPTGQLECANGTYNCGWTWRMTPASITFAEITIEVCDATPSYVQGNCASFPNGQYCPWSAELIELRDCRTQPSCPAAPR